MGLRAPRIHLRHREMTDTRKVGKPLERVRRVQPFMLIVRAVAIGLIFLSLLPLLRVCLRLFVPSEGASVGAFSAVVQMPDLPKLLGTTLLVVIASTIVALGLGSAMAYLSERTNASTGLLSQTLPLIPFFVPPIAGAIGWILLLSPRAGYLNVGLRAIFGFTSHSDSGTIPSGPFNIYSIYGLIFVYAVYMIPFAYLIVSAGLRNADSSLEEQSRLCGAGFGRTMRRIVLPLLKPSLGAATLLLVWYGLSQFAIPSTIGTGANIEVLTVRIVRLAKFTFPARLDMSVALSSFILIVLVLLWLGQRRLAASGQDTASYGKGRGAGRWDLGAWRWPARATLAIYIVVAGVLPAIAMVLVVLSGYWSPVPDWGNLSLGNVTRMLQDHVSRKAILNSLGLAIACASIAVVAAALLTVVTRGPRQGFLAIVADSAVKLPAAISGLVLGIGFILAFGGWPFFLHGTLVILLLAHVAHLMPQASLAADTASSQVGREMVEASQLAGAGVGRTFTRIQVPIMLPGLIAGWAVVFVFVLGDVTISALLGGPTNMVVGLRLLEIFENSTWGSLSALALVVTAISTVVVTAVFAFTRGGGAFGGFLSGD